MTEEEFYELCQDYRHTMITDQPMICWAYERLKAATFDRLYSLEAENAKLKAELAEARKREQLAVDIADIYLDSHEAALDQAEKRGFEAAREQMPNRDRPVYGYGQSYEMVPRYYSFEDYLKRAQQGGQ